MNGSFNLKDKMMLCVGIFGNFCEYVRFLHRFLYTHISKTRLYRAIPWKNRAESGKRNVSLIRVCVCAYVCVPERMSEKY